ncbi:hypothetical protein L6R29_19235 [Myxococcota bacterium]|nr:hypothetical protein [Myxococcota bacterium]
MLGWWKKQFAGWLVGMAFLLSSLTTSAAPSWSEAAARWSQHQQRGQTLQQKRTILREKVKTLADQLDALKRDAERGGLFGLPARLRLPTLRANAQVWGQKLERVERAWHSHHLEQEGLRRELLSIIRKNLYALQMRWNQARTDAERQTVRESIVVWSDRAKKIHPALQETPQRPAINTPVVRIDPLDGPSDIRQKVDTLRDIEDRIARRMKHLQAKLHALEQQQQRTQQDQKLAQRVSEMTQEDELFNENDRNPRVAGGREKQAPTRVQTNSSPSAPQGGAQQGSSAPQSGAQQGSSDPNRGTTAPSKDSNSFESHPTPPAVGSGAPSPAPSTDSLPKGSTPSPTQMRPQVGFLPSERADTTAQDPMNPQGPLDQKIKALRDYKHRLTRQLEALRKQQRRFLRKASQLERKERQRRAKKQR